VRDISHEMRTPLNCVTLGLDILLESKDISPEKRHEYLLDVRQSVTVAVQTLNELLMYDKIESDTLKVDKTTVSVLELMDTIKTFSLSMISASINFSHNIADVEEELSKFVIDGDLHKLNQVLRNILSNAIKFTPKGGCIAVLVELYEASSDRAMFAVTRYNINSTDILKFNRLKISCTDTGPGISKVYLSCLFLFRALLLLITTPPSFILSFNHSFIYSTFTRTIRRNYSRASFSSILIYCRMGAGLAWGCSSPIRSWSCTRVACLYIPKERGKDLHLRSHYPSHSNQMLLPYRPGRFPPVNL
jgi:hypothetical protein